MEKGRAETKDLIFQYIGVFESLFLGGSSMCTFLVLFYFLYHVNAMEIGAEGDIEYFSSLYFNKQGTGYFNIALVNIFYPFYFFPSQ